MPTLSGHTQRRRTHVPLLAVVASLGMLNSGCDAPADVDVAVTVRSVTREGVELGVETKPGVFVSANEADEFGSLLATFSGSEPKTDAEGRASITVQSTEESEKFSGARPSLSVHVIEEGLISQDPESPFGGPKLIGYGGVEVDFDLARLQRAPASPTGPWLYLVSAQPRDVPYCLELYTAEDGPSIGTGSSPMPGMVFLSEPGTQATIAGIGFAIDSTGLGVFEPTAAALFPLVMTPVLQRPHGVLPVRIEHDSQDAVTASIPFKLDAGCSAKLHEYLLGRVEAGEPLLEGATPTGDLALVLKADGSVRSRRATPKRAPRKLPDPVPLASARYVAVETETSRTPGPKCTRTAERAAGVRNGQDMVKVSTATFDPVFIETEFKLVDLTNGKELGRKGFSPNRSDCRPNVYPDSVETSGWVGQHIAEHQRGGAK